MKGYKTQMKAAKKVSVLRKWNVLQKRIYGAGKFTKAGSTGQCAIPCNNNHKILSPEGTGTGMRTKINVNLGISGDCNNMINHRV